MPEEDGILEIENEDGSLTKLQVIEYFEHEKEDYVILADLSALLALDEEDDDEAAGDVGFYVLKVMTNADGSKEYVDPDDTKLDELFAKAEEILDELYECDDDCDCDCDDDECDCGCHHNDEN